MNKFSPLGFIKFIIVFGIALAIDVFYIDMAFTVGLEQDWPTWVIWLTVAVILIATPMMGFVVILCSWLIAAPFVGTYKLYRTLVYDDPF